MIELDVWLDRARVARLAHDAASNRFSLDYLPAWVSQRAAFPLAPCLPLQGHAGVAAEVHSAAVRQFFENLLPEGEALDHAAAAARTSKANLAGLLVALGKETAGAIRVTLPQEQLEAGADALRQVTREQLSQRIEARQSQPFSVWDGRVRLSIAGYQDKIAVYERRGQWFLVDGPDLASTYIVKPAPVAPGLESP